LLDRQADEREVVAAERLAIHAEHRAAVALHALEHGAELRRHVAHGELGRLELRGRELDAAALLGPGLLRYLLRGFFLGGHRAAEYREPAAGARLLRRMLEGVSFRRAGPRDRAGRAATARALRATSGARRSPRRRRG